MDKDAKRLKKLVKKAGSVLGERPDSLESVVERCTQNKMQAIMDNVSHPLHRILADQKSGRRNLFHSVTCKNKRFKNTFFYQQQSCFLTPRPAARPGMGNVFD